MIRRIFSRAAVIAASFGISHAAVAGNLTPPAGPVLSTQRRQITALPYTINQSGSYVVMADLTGVPGQNGITIAANDVTIDLNGFTLHGVPGSQSGISTVTGPPWRNLVIYNGMVRNWGNDGINMGSSFNMRIENVSATNNSNYGMEGQRNFQVHHCAADENGSWGIGVFGADGIIADSTAFSNGGHGMSGAMNIRNCTASLNGGDGISPGSGGTVVACTSFQNTGYGFSLGGNSRISDCSAQSNSTGGISAYLGDTIVNCSSGSNVGHGIVAYGADVTIAHSQSSNNSGTGIYIDGGNVSYCTTSYNQTNGIEIVLGNAHVEGCTATRNKGDGIILADRSTAVSNTCCENGALVGGYGAGIYCYGFQSRIDSNHVSGNDVGIDASLPVRNTIMRNSATTNTFDYSIHPMNDFAPISTSAFSTNPWSNIEY